MRLCIVYLVVLILSLAALFSSSSTTAENAVTSTVDPPLLPHRFNRTRNVNSAAFKQRHRHVADGSDNEGRKGEKINEKLRITDDDIDDDDDYSRDDDYYTRPILSPRHRNNNVRGLIVLNVEDGSNLNRLVSKNKYKPIKIEQDIQTNRRKRRSNEEEEEEESTPISTSPTEAAEDETTFGPDYEEEEKKDEMTTQTIPILVDADDDKAVREKGKEIDTSLNDETSSNNYSQTSSLSSLSSQFSNDDSSTISDGSDTTSLSSSLSPSSSSLSLSSLSTEHRQIDEKGLLDSDVNGTRAEISSTQSTTTTSLYAAKEEKDPIMKLNISSSTPSSSSSSQPSSLVPLSTSPSTSSSSTSYVHLRPPIVDKKYYYDRQNEVYKEIMDNDSIKVVGDIAMDREEFEKTFLPWSSWSVSRRFIYSSTAKPPATMTLPSVSPPPPSLTTTTTTTTNSLKIYALFVNYKTAFFLLTLTATSLGIWMIVRHVTRRCKRSVEDVSQKKPSSTFYRSSYPPLAKGYDEVEQFRRLKRSKAVYKKVPANDLPKEFQLVPLKKSSTATMTTTAERKTDDVIRDTPFST